MLLGSWVRLLRYDETGRSECEVMQLHSSLLKVMLLTYLRRSVNCWLVRWGGRWGGLAFYVGSGWRFATWPAWSDVSGASCWISGSL
ncbi:hypothetical protein Tco_0942147 [Tanacetum coccineum]|uniref:Uncharacterized protein n=1 Tax=Tanacetum coccineum TaxID=301880 RepID=A0ABQ5I961_9ASTR